MTRRWRLALVALGLVAALPAGAAAAAPAARGARSITYPVGVDHATPAGHNFEYVDYFPRTGLRLHVGDVIDFGWASTPDGLHTATLLAAGETPAQAYQRYPLVTPDADDPGGQLQFDPAVLAPSDPACGASAASACTFDGGADLNSGAIGTDGTSHFFARIAAPAGTQLTFICLIHPGMVGTAQVVPARQPGSELEDVREAAAEQGVRDTLGAFRAEEASERASVRWNPNGTRTVTMTAGTATQYVEVAEMLPRTLRVRPGDTVTWVTRSLKDPHTVTFPVGDGPGEPLPTVCESGGGDVPFVPTGSGPPCGNPALLEVHFEPAPGGSTAISTPTTFGTSGVIANPPAPFPNSYSFSFPNAGTFAYQCRIHDHMVGTIVSS